MPGKPIKVADNTYEQLRLIAKLQKTTLAGAIDMATADYLENHREELEAAVSEERRILGLDERPAGS